MDCRWIANGLLMDYCISQLDVNQLSIRYQSVLG